MRYRLCLIKLNPDENIFQLYANLLTFKRKNAFTYNRFELVKYWMLVP